MSITNPKKSWHIKRGQEARTRWRHWSTMPGEKRRSEYWKARADAEANAVETYANYNPTRRRHHRVDKGISILGIAAIAGAAYLLLRNR